MESLLQQLLPTINMVVMMSLNGGGDYRQVVLIIFLTLLPLLFKKGIELLVNGLTSDCFSVNISKKKSPSIHKSLAVYLQSKLADIHDCKGTDIVQEEMIHLCHEGRLIMFYVPIHLPIGKFNLKINNFNATVQVSKIASKDQKD